MKIPLIRTFIGEPEIEAVARVMRTGQLAAGPEVAAFEREFASVAGTDFAVAVNSGTAALHCALNAAGVGTGDEVVTTPFTFAATATPILMQRGVPRFVDIDARTFNADLEQLLAACTPRTKAVVSVDLFGLPADDQGLAALRERGVAVVEDACQAIGASRRGKPAGSLGDVSCFSLYATKNLMTGEGGVLATDDEGFAKSARRFRQHGEGDRYEYLALGYNYRLTDLAAAIGRVQLSRLQAVNSRRRANAALYDELLAGIAGVTTPYVPPDVQHAYHQYSILVDPELTHNRVDRNGLREQLAARGVGTGVYYPTPLHLNRLFSGLGYAKGSFPVAERVASQITALPIHPLLEEAEIRTVCDAIREIAGA